MTSSDIQLNHEILTLGVIISVMVYAGVAVLALTYIPLLLKTSHTISRRMRNFLLAYVAFMVATSTVNTVTLIIVFTLGRTIFSHAGNEIEDMHAFPNGIAGGLCITLASWAADGFMLWRCAVLYKGISQRYRLAILTLLILLATASFGFCAYFLSDPENGVLIYMITISTTTINTIAAILIASRILYIQRHNRTVGSESNNRYTTIIIICIESSALIVFCSILYIVLALSWERIPVSFLFMQSLVHVNVISPLLIVYRVALGKAVTRQCGDEPVAY